MSIAAQECAAHAFCIGEADGVSDNRNRFMSVAQPYAGGLAPQTFDRPCRRFSRFLSEEATELSYAQARGIGEALD